ncbi:hypothetical protein MASR2M15_19440 [Anaerolineales bacterium]
MKVRLASLVFFFMVILLMSVSSIMAQEAFPVTIEHKFGETTIEAAPQRIVVLGFTEQDPYFALGIKPVAIRYWFGDEDNAIFPWAEAAAQGAQPEVLNLTYGALNLEAILALEPDLISAIDSGISREEYEQLSQIAPTIAQSDEYVDFGMPWQETTRMVGQVVGKSAEAEALISEIETKIESIRAAHPEFEGQTVSVAYNNAGQYGFYTEQDTRGRFFTDLGFVVPEALNELAGESFYANVSEERLDLLDQDLLVFLGLQFNEGGSEAALQAIQDNPLVSQLQAVQEGRVLYIPDEYDSALQFSTILALDYLLDELVPEIDAVAGDHIAISCEAGFRAVEDAVNQVLCVPENPQRIVSLTDGDTDALLALGVNPVGVSNGRGSNTPPQYLMEYLPEDYVSVGTFFEPNLEIVLGLEPDLILFSYGDFAEPALLEQLSQIAPVFIPVSGDDSWRDLLEGVGDALNMADQADLYLSEYDERVDTLSAQIEPGAEFIVARWSAEGPQVMAPYIFAPAELQALGMVMPEEIPDLESGHAHSAPLSLETVDILDVDWAFIGTLQSEGEAAEALQAVFDNPLFQQLEVVKNKHVIIIDGSIWTSSGGPLAANRLLDDIEAKVIGLES